MPQYGKFIAVVFIQAVLGAEPHESPAVLGDAFHNALGKTLFDGDLFKGDIRTLGRDTGNRNHQGQQKEGKD